jgi:hypothetical protein
VTRSDADGVLRAPVISFMDEHGVRHEFTSPFSSLRPKPPVGDVHGVAHLPGRPDIARIDTDRHVAHVLVVTLGSAVVFLGAAVVSVLTDRAGG